MKFQAFKKLKVEQQKALMVAMHVRNSMEDFHCTNLSDAQMKELNPIIRTAIYEALCMWNRALFNAHHDTGKKFYSDYLDWLGLMIPDYWEVPNDSRLLKQKREIEKSGVSVNPFNV